MQNHVHVKVGGWHLFFAFIALMNLLSCSNEEIFEVDLSGKPWMVDGVLVSSNGKGIPRKRIEVIRIEEVRGKPAGFFFAAVITDSQGRFYFETPIDGVYALSAEREFPCQAHAELGEMKSGRKSIRLMLESDNCVMLL